MKNRKNKYFIWFIITFLLEVMIALYIQNNIIRNYIGDILIIICIYFLAKMIFKNKIKNLSLYILILGVFVEIMQYFNVMKNIAGNNKILKIILGSTFDIKDIICYIIGFYIIKLYEKRIILKDNHLSKEE